MSPSNGLRAHAEERPQGRVSKQEQCSPFETAHSAPPQGEGCEVAR